MLGGGGEHMAGRNTQTKDRAPDGTAIADCGADQRTPVHPISEGISKSLLLPLLMKPLVDRLYAAAGRRSL